MATSSPTIPKGTRDFSPLEMSRRNYIFSIIKTVFEKYGYAPIETPSMENLSTLMGKYGEEGDKLLFKVLNSGDFLSDFDKSQRDLIIRIIKTKETLLSKYITNKDLSNKTVQKNLITFLETKDNYFEESIKKIVLNQLKLEGYYFDDKDFKISKKESIELKNRIKEIIADVLTELLKNKAISPIVGIEKGLRYDLTVPFARYVVMHQNELTFPFKRYQIQPVWRADKPQKGRYREFYQCDADIIGSKSLINEAELVAIIKNIFDALNISVTIKMNNRKILSAIAELIGAPEKIIDITVAIDKLDKIGLENVNKELSGKGLSQEMIDTIQPIINLSGSNESKIEVLSTMFESIEIGKKGVEEMKAVFRYVKAMGIDCNLELDLTLARGLNYYTGAIFEVKANEAAMGSISGGGRYDDLTGIFGLKEMSGVGISFGADRIYDVLNELNRFPETLASITKVLFCNFGPAEEEFTLPYLGKLREVGINCEIYPENAKMKKQFSYADNKNIPFVVICGENEMNEGAFNVKNMKTGEQSKITKEELVDYLAKTI